MKPRSLSALTALSPILALSLQCAACSRTEQKPAPAAEAAEPADSATIAAIASALVEGEATREVLDDARSRGAYKATLSRTIIELDGRITQVEAKTKQPGGEAIRAQLDEIRAARWRLDKAQRAVQSASEEDWKKAIAEYEAAVQELGGKIDKALGVSKP